MYRRISPQKIKAVRGKQTRKSIVERINYFVTAQELYAYEKGKYRPSDKKLAYLIKALECSYEDISEPHELIAA